MMDKGHVHDKTFLQRGGQAEGYSVLPVALT
jgi:hypothetical protein